MKFLSLALVLVLSGCAVKNIDENYKQILLEDNASSELNLDTFWWKQYEQSYLDELVELALKNNTDLAKAAINVNKALAQAGILEANLIPSFNAGIETSSSKNIKEGGASSRNFGSSIGLSYELDLWQKLANSKDAAMFEADATKFDLEASKLSVINSVTDAYFQILYLNESIKTYEQILEIYNELNEIVGLKFELGKEEALSLKQINSQLLSAQNKIENAKKELVVAKKMLRILLNERPDFELKFEGLTLSPIKKVGVDLDVPTSAIANRPDIRAAIYRIEEGILNYKVSQKEFYPSITLGASLKSSTDKKEEAFNLKFLNGNIALNLPFLNYHKLKSNLKVSEANFELAKLNYISTLNSALNEIDAFYKGYLNDEALLINYQEQIKNYEEISKIYELKYSYGKVELKEFLEAKNSELEAKIGLLKAKYTLLQDELNIYKAMAGKFNR
ncbi:TolC family protein [Campylobacter concisus]|uniref:TolC family protein n=1 Tax=Campylobacter concisus TaxID=199 RepID=UPI00122C27F3|nr:TolC family protein [Campylobacter concisus]